MPAAWTPEDLALNPCSGNSHAHLSRGQAAEFMQATTVDELRAPTRKTKGILRLKRSIALRGLSCYVGGELVECLSHSSSRDWALAMLRNIRLRRESRSCVAAGDQGFAQEHAQLGDQVS
jgi:hypothetical protein